ncbi:MAG TPA: hypothetical protein VFS08_12740 [Gemmatimonadaceae bacterium]|nr:hypothetical protein [Gemmatimonadaceae bacterium]
MLAHAAVTLLIIVLGTWVFGLVFHEAAERRAVLLSAAVAFVIQLLTFVLARRTVGENIFVGWGVGVLLRFVVLGIYAFLVVEPLALPAEPALLSLVAFFFVSTLVEPLLLTL